MLVSFLEYMSEPHRWQIWWATVVSMTAIGITSSCDFRVAHNISCGGLFICGLVLHINEDVILAPMMFAMLAGSWLCGGTNQERGYA